MRYNKYGSEEPPKEEPPKKKSFYERNKTYIKAAGVTALATGALVGGHYAARRYSPGYRQHGVKVLFKKSNNAVKPNNLSKIDQQIHETTAHINAENKLHEDLGKSLYAEHKQNPDNSSILTKINEHELNTFNRNAQNQERISELMQLKEHETQQKSLYNRTKKLGTSVWNTGSFVFDSINRLNDLANNPIVGPLIAKQMEGLQNSMDSNKETTEKELEDLMNKESQTPEELQENEEKLQKLQERQEHYNILVKESDDTAKKLNAFKDKKRLTKKDLANIKEITQHLNEVITEIKNFNNAVAFGKSRFGKRKPKRKTNFGNKQEDPIVKVSNKDVDLMVKVIKEDPKTESRIKKFLYKTLIKIGVKLGDYLDYTLKELIKITLNYLGLMFMISVLYNYYLL
jgi:hypothetical protein